jgi:hypothetical protein
MSEVTSEALKCILIAAMPYIVSLIGRLFSYVREYIEASTRNQWLLAIEKEAFEVVAAIGQKTAGPLKEAAADGKLTDEEKNRLKQIAMDELQARLKGIPMRLFPDLVGKLGHAIEAAVPQAKVLQNPPQAQPSK